MTASLVAAAVAALLLADPFALLGPSMLTSSDRRAVERGEVVSDTIDGLTGQVGVFAVTRIDTAPESLVVNARAIENLKQSSFVTGIKRFSTPPVIEDLDTLVLPSKELQSAAACKPGSCSLKLTATEAEQLRVAASIRDSFRDQRVQMEFRRIVLARALEYLAANARELAPLVKVEPRAGTESFLYWSQETYGAGKPVVVVTHLNILPPSPSGDAAAIVIGKQVFASHYMTGALAVTAITSDPASGERFLVYRNVTSLDLLGGVLGPIRRLVLESRLRRDVPGIMKKLRARLESNERPAR
jgi:hypothetical protein